MKIDHNLVWSEVHADKSITIGFTKKCIDELLPECFHVMQADATTVREKGPMLVLETNDGLESIKSPFTGKISYFNSKARNYPDRLTTEDTILTILPPGVEAKTKPKVIGNWVDQRIQFIDFFEQPVPPPPAPVQINMEVAEQLIADRRATERRIRNQAVQALAQVRANRRPR
jgi:hypothetical protein